MRGSDVRITKLVGYLNIVTGRKEKLSSSWSGCGWIAWERDAIKVGNVAG